MSGCTVSDVQWGEVGTQLGVLVYCERCSVGLGGFDGWPGGKALEKLTIFSLKLV